MVDVEEGAVDDVRIRGLGDGVPALGRALQPAGGQHGVQLQEQGISLKDWFANDPDRVAKLSFETSDLLFDLSKNLVTDETVKLLCDLAREMGVEERRAQYFNGTHINTTEDRAVLHTALRRPRSEAGSLIVDGQDAVADVNDVINIILKVN